MNELFAFWLICFTSFFTLVNPLGIMPVFMTMTAYLEPPDKRRTAVKAVLVAGLAILLFALTGQLIFQFFGISVNSLKIVGGIIFFLVGYDMLQARLASFKVSKKEIKAYVDDISVTPLGIPLLCGPGAITNAIVLWEEAGTYPMKGMMLTAIASVLFLTLLTMVGADRISRFIGPTGNKILMRIMGLIVMVIAVEFLFSGLTPIVREMLMLPPTGV